jgi:hypothetical protein
MGASSFHTRATGDTAKIAFENATEGARYQYGHRGYTGTIAEKNSFRMLTVPSGQSVDQFVDALMWDDNHWINDKTGPAGCINLGSNEYLFFGMARS